MKKYIFLSTCDTCKRIQKELSLPTEVELQDIKKNPITEEQLEMLYSQVGSYEGLINNRARKFKELGLSPKDVSEEKRKELLLQDYTFLKRPVLIWDDKFFVGNAKKTVEEAKHAVSPK
jgi:arsenate reductase